MAICEFISRNWCIVLMFFGIIVFELILLEIYSLYLSPDSSIFRISSLEGEDEVRLGNSIFFHETSFPSHSTSPLTPRQACSVESAAKQNPHRKVYLIYSSPTLKFIPKDELINILNKYENVRIVWIELEEYARGTIVEQFLKKKELYNSSHAIEHSSDILRLLTLFKFGGTYLDLDMIVVKNLDDLGRDWVAKQVAYSVNNAAIDLSLSDVGRNYSNFFLSESVDNFRGDHFGWNGPGALTRVLVNKCQSEDVNNFNRTSCLGFEVYRPQIFYPIPWTVWRIYFEPKLVNFVAAMDDTYGFHFWNYMSKDEPTSPDVQTPYTFLAEKYCPLTYQYSKNFF